MLAILMPRFVYHVPVRDHGDDCLSAFQRQVWLNAELELDVIQTLAVARSVIRHGMAGVGRFAVQLVPAPLTFLYVT
jgi:hypothetical protein